MHRSDLPGKALVELVCPEPQCAINAGLNAGIVVSEITCADSLCWQCLIDAHKLQEMERIVERYGGQMHIVRKYGLFFNLLKLRRRGMLALALLLILLLTLWLPTRVLFVEISGNERVSTKLIMDKAEICGITFGATRATVRSEAVKNRLLSEIPQLQWVGVNTIGCVAKISVEERKQPEIKNSEGKVSSIIATWDGVVRDVTVYRGNPLCRPGEVVYKGQVLVSGYTDVGFCIRAESADAEITAQTKRSICATTPMEYIVRTGVTGRKTHYRLKIGKKTIKLYKDSGISGPTCVRIYKEYSAMLPGGFTLPVSLITEEIIINDSGEGNNPQYEEQEWMEAVSDTYLKTQMLSGQILKSCYTRTSHNGVWTQHADYDCVEIIGRIHEEEQLFTNGKTN